MQSRVGEITKIEPILDVLSGVKIYHYAYNNHFYSTILTRNVFIILFILNID
jgi:hypothetical protein